MNEYRFRIKDTSFQLTVIPDPNVVEGRTWTPKQVEDACRLELLNNVDADGTDFAHPAFWRGSDASCGEAAAQVKQLCAGSEQDAGVCNEPWQSARQAIIDLRRERDSLRAQVTRLRTELERLRNATERHEHQVQPE